MGVLDTLIMAAQSLTNFINSLWLSDIICRRRSGSTLVQVMACCLTAPSHYLNQCWLIISKARQWHSSEVNFTRDNSAINHLNKLDNFLPHIKSPRGQRVNSHLMGCIIQCPIKYVHYLALLRFVCVQDTYDPFSNIRQVCFEHWSPGQSWHCPSAPDLGKNDQYQPSTKNTKARNLCVFLGTLKRKCRNVDNIFITCCTGSCQNDKVWCNQWPTFSQFMCSTWHLCFKHGDRF